MQFDFFIEKRLLNKLKIRKEINNLEHPINIKNLEELYNEKYKEHFKKWFIPKINKFLKKNYQNYSIEINQNFFKKMLSIQKIHITKDYLFLYMIIKKY